MLEKYKDRLKFYIENMYIALKPIGIGIIDDSGTIVAECGSLDIETSIKHVNIFLKSSINILNLISTKNKNIVTSITESDGGSFYITYLNFGFSLIIFLPKSINATELKKDIDRMSSEICVLFSEISGKIKKGDNL